MKPETNSWQAIHAELMRRISERIWKPGERIPDEVDLAAEFGCARATVNRAMRAIAEAGLVERRRKAGTRVALNPVRKAKLDIPITRLEVEAQGHAWSHELLYRQLEQPPADIRTRFGLPENAKLLHIKGLHRADGMPYLFEDRWINSKLVPEVLETDLSATSVNEWLVNNTPFSHGHVTLSAVSATKDDAEILHTDPATPLFVNDRVTYYGDDLITCVRIVYAPGYEMRLTL